MIEKLIIIYFVYITMLNKLLLIMNTTTPFITLNPIALQILKTHKIGIFIDVSGSTTSMMNSINTILDVESNFVKKISNEFTNKPLLVAWDTNARTLNSLSELVSNGGTQPACIFDIAQIKDIDAAIILTDGEIDTGSINNFTESMIKYGLHLRVVIGVIVGRTLKSPANANISVLIPAMINDSCILYHNGEELYSVWTCGCFRNNWGIVDINNDTEWKNIKQITIDQIQNMQIPILDPSQNDSLLSKKYIPFGSGLFFNPELLLTYTPSWDEVLQFPFDRICQYYRITNAYDKLITWFTNLKNKFMNEFIVSDEERNIMNEYVMNCINKQPNKQPNKQLTSKYCNVRNAVLVKTESYQNGKFDELKNPKVIQLAKLFHRMMSIMEEEKVESKISSSYTCASFSCSKYSNTFNATDYKAKNVDPEFTKPDKWLKKFLTHDDTPQILGECSICFEESIIFFLIREKFPSGNNMSEFDSNPLKYFYPHGLCSKCAEYFCNNGFDPVKVPCKFGLPIVNTNNKNAYLNDFSILISNIVNNTTPNTNIKNKLFSYSYSQPLPLASKPIPSVGILIKFIKYAQQHFKEDMNISSCLELFVEQFNQI